MKTSWFKFAGALSLAFAATSVVACSSGDIDGSDVQNGSADDSAISADQSLDESLELGTAEQGLMSCSNPDGTNSAMAAFAVAVAKELGRWQANKDFVVFGTSGQSEASPGP